LAIVTLSEFFSRSVCGCIAPPRLEMTSRRLENFGWPGISPSISASDCGRLRRSRRSSAWLARLENFVRSTQVPIINMPKIRIGWRSVKVPAKSITGSSPKGVGVYVGN